MKTNKIALSALFFLFTIVFSPAALAQQIPSGSSEIPAFCIPLPEDIDQLQVCNDLISQANVGNYQEPNSTATGPGTGERGMASAYNPNNNTILFISTNVRGLDADIIGQIYNSETMQPVGGSFIIDLGRLSSGSPRAVYNTVTNNFFITWSDERPSPERSSIYGRFVNPDGSMPAADFAVYVGLDAVIGDLTIDYVNSRYVQGFDILGGGHRMVTISFAGEASAAVNLAQIPGNWEGMSSVTYNSELNEYWSVYATVVAGGDTPRQDGRIMFARIDAATMQKIGSPVQLSQTRIGANAFSHPKIVYSPQDGTALATWMEAGRTPGMSGEVYGRRINRDLSLGPEISILTYSTYPNSNFYGAPKNMQYNPATGTYGIAVEDNNGGTTFVELMPDGSIIEIREIISPQGTGNFNPCLGYIGIGFVTCTSRGYKDVTIAKYESYYRSTTGGPASVAAPRVAEDLDTTNFAEMLTRLYLYSIAIAGILAVLMSVFGGYKVMSARGNAAQASEGRDYITSSLIGLVLLLGAFLILNTLNPDLTRFDIPSLNLFK